MEIVTINSDYEVVIPESIREALRLRPGQKVQLVSQGERIELIPCKHMKEMRGFLKGIDTTIKREQDRI
jgi:AbrB family looped-hinge helix DNA binding protein